MSVTAATATTPVTTFSVLLRLPPTSSVLWPITHPPDPPARVVGDQERAVRQHQQPGRPEFLPSSRMLIRSGGRLSVIATSLPPMSSRSLLVAHSAPVVGLKAIPTELRSPRANTRPPVPLRL